MAELDRRMAELLDNEAIRDLLIHFSYCVDDKRWDDWQACFAEGARVEFPFASYDGLDGIAEWAEAALAAYPVTHHFNACTEIALDGDRAHARSKLLAAHLVDASSPAAHFDVAGVYHWDLVRTQAGWRIAHLQLTVSYLNGQDPTGLAPTA